MGARGRRRAGVRLAVVALAASAMPALAPASATARDDVVRSFDGTPIVLSWFRAPGLERGERAPTVLVGHGWGGGRYGRTDQTSGAGESLGPAPLLRRGYNVLSWDARGFGESGEMVRVDSIRWEARDVRRLITYVSNRPTARLDGRRDPRVGMAGGSYGGGIQLNAAAIDRRLDAIVPGIAWNSLVSSLGKRGAPKGGWGSILYGAGIPTSIAPGLVGQAGLQAGTLHPQVTEAFANGLLMGRFSREDRRFFHSRGPVRQVRRIDAPTLLLQGTVDTLFTPQEAVTNYRLLRRAGTPVKMVWFCGGHGMCGSAGGSGALVPPANQADYLRRAALAWFARHLKRRSVRTGPGFAWFGDDGRLRTARRYSSQSRRALRGRGSGTLPLVPGGGASSGTLIAATPAVEAVDVPIGPARRPGDLVAAPSVELTYSGTAVPSRTHVYAQLVDEQRNRVVSNQVAPVRLTLDGARRTTRVPLEIPAAHASRGDRYTLQLIPGTSVYFPQRAAGTVRFGSVKVALPVAR